MLPCNQCDREFKNIQGLTRHQAAHKAHQNNGTAMPETKRTSPPSEFVPVNELLRTYTEDHLDTMIVALERECRALIVLRGAVREMNGTANVVRETVDTVLPL